jgi:hypothetical protein
VIVSKLGLKILSAPLFWGGAFFFAASGCSIKRPPEQHFYDQHIQPILNNFCVGNTSPCHRIDSATGIALGNLDLSSFESVQKRRDVLRTYGSYPQPLLLLKSLTLGTVQIPYQQNFYDSEIKHTGGNPIAPTSDAYYELKRWLDNGANRDGLAPPPVANMGKGACNTAVPLNQPPIDPTNPAYQSFIVPGGVQDKIRSSCAFATCHSSPQSDFYMTCGDDDAQKQYNFSRAASFVAAMGIAAEQSEILLRPLAPAAGGISHTGGVFFDSRDNEGWKSWKAWAEVVQANPPYTLTRSTGQQFFEANVMPKLLQRGCALEGCHSPDGFNDFRLRSGAQGFFSPFALARNYETALKEFIALDTVDIKQSRAIKKTIFASSGGITHRAGPVLDGVDAVSQVADSEAPCAAVYDPMTATAFCTFKEWHRIERQDHAAAVSPMATGDVIPLAFVSRMPNRDNLLQFDTYEGGADLKIADAVLGAGGRVASVGNVRSALGGCGLGGDVDVRGPEWSYDGTQLIFAARPGAASGFDLWVIDGGGTGACRQLTTDGGRMQGLVRVHNFDPVFAPDGTVVFASTRSGTLTLKNFFPNSDLFRVAPGGDFSKPEQMTWLLNSEIGPAFMQDGRLSFTAEKATPEFYQLSGRRMNWDRTDYHPLLAQRAKSTDTFTDDLHPSVDYQQATEIREGLDRNFLIILSDANAIGAGGALATFNRSIGPFEADRTEVSFVRSLQIVDAAATGRAGTAGVYRSPFSLPNGEILASYAANVTDPTAQIPKYDLVAVAADGTRRALASDPSMSYVEAALGYKRAERELFTNLPQLVFGGHGDPAGDAAADTGIMHFPDLPVLATLLGANLRRGRDVRAFDSTASLRVYRENPPPSTSAPRMGSQMVFSDHTLLGVAGLESDHSVKVALPARTPLIFELIDGSGKTLFMMQEEHQLSPGEYITPGPPRAIFNGICGGCHGSLTGEELDVAVTPDALTGASVSLSRDKPAKSLQ